MSTSMRQWDNESSERNVFIAINSNSNQGATPTPGFIIINEKLANQNLGNPENIIEFGHNNDNQ